MPERLSFSTTYDRAMAESATASVNIPETAIHHQEKKAPWEHVQHHTRTSVKQEPTTPQGFFGLCTIFRNRAAAPTRIAEGLGTTQYRGVKLFVRAP